MNRQLATVWWVVAAVVIGLFASPVSAQDDFRVIYVEADASAMVDPDVIEWTITLDTRDTAPAEARAKNTRQMEALIELVDDLDIDEDDFETSHLQLCRVYERNQGNRWVEREYLYTKCFRGAVIRMRDFDQFDELLTSPVELGAEFEIAYRVSTLEEIRHELSLEALRKAKDLAEEQAGILGEEVGAAHRIQVYEFRSNSGGSSLFSDGHDDDVDTLCPGKVRIAVLADVSFRLVP